MGHVIVMGCGWNQNKLTERGWVQDTSTPKRCDEVLFVGHSQDEARAFLAKRYEADKAQAEAGGDLTGWTYYVTREVESN